MSDSPNFRIVSPLIRENTNVGIKRLSHSSEPDTNLIKNDPDSFGESQKKITNLGNSGGIVIPENILDMELSNFKSFKEIANVKKIQDSSTVIEPKVASPQFASVMRRALSSSSPLTELKNNIKEVKNQSEQLRTYLSDNFIKKVLSSTPPKDKDFVKQAVEETRNLISSFSDNITALEVNLQNKVLELQGNNVEPDKINLFTQNVITDINKLKANLNVLQSSFENSLKQLE